MKMNFEIVVTKISGRFKAMTPTFPDCFGEGDTEEEAVEDLGNVITLHLSDTVRRTLDEVKQLGLFRRMSEEDLGKPGNKKAYSSGKEHKVKDGKMLFSGKLPISSEWLNKIDKRQAGPKIKRILGVGSVPGSGPVPLMPSLLDELQNPLLTELVDEGLLFGVPLSLN